MEARVARLEAGLSDIKATLARLEPVLSQVSKDLAQVSKDVVDIRTKDLVELKAAAAKLEGRVSQLPSTIQLLGFVLAVPTIAGVTRFVTGP